MTNHLSSKSDSFLEAVTEIIQLASLNRVQEEYDRTVEKELLRLVDLSTLTRIHQKGLEAAKTANETSPKELSGLLKGCESSHEEYFQVRISLNLSTRFKHRFDEMKMLVQKPSEPEKQQNNGRLSFRLKEKPEEVPKKLNEEEERKRLIEETRFRKEHEEKERRRREAEARGRQEEEERRKKIRDEEERLRRISDELDRREEMRRREEQTTRLREDNDRQRMWLQLEQEKSQRRRAEATRYDTERRSSVNHASGSHSFGTSSSRRSTSAGGWTGTAKNKTSGGLWGVKRK